MVGEMLLAGKPQPEGRGKGPNSVGSQQAKSLIALPPRTAQ